MRLDPARRGTRGRCSRSPRVPPTHSAVCPSPSPLVLAGVDRLMLAVLTSAYTVDEVGGDEALLKLLTRREVVESHG